MSAHVPRMPAAAITGSLVALLLALSAPASAQPSGQATDTGRGLSIQFADGKVVTRALRPTGGIWTPNFPRITGADTSRDGVPLTTLDVRHVVEGADVAVTVTLYYGGVYKNPLKVATVRVSAGSPVQVKKLRAHGVEPITLSLVSIPSTVTYVPEAVSASAQLDVRVEPVGPNVSAYRVVLANRSRVPLMSIYFTGLRDGKEFSGGRKGKRNVPLVAPGEEYVFEIAIGGLGHASGDTPEAWQPIDRVVITSLLWQDGLVEGDRVVAKRQGMFEMRRQAEIGRFVAILRAAPGQPPATLRAAVARSMAIDLETQEARDGVLADLDAFERTSRSRDGRDFETWLGGTVVEHEQWFARIVILKT